MPNKGSASDVSALAFFNRARQYHEAAECVFKECGTLRDPIHFLYFHTVELTLKAFLRSHGLAILGTDRKTHNLTRLYDECRDLGLKIGPADIFGIGNIVPLLDSANEDQGLRYYNLKSVVMADLSWTREVVEQLIQAVGLHLGVRPNSTPGPVAKLTLVWGKPVSKYHVQP